MLQCTIFCKNEKKNEREKKPSGKLILSHSDHNLPLGIVLEKSQFGLGSSTGAEEGNW